MHFYYTQSDMRRQLGGWIRHSYCSIILILLFLLLLSVPVVVVRLTELLSVELVVELHLMT